MTDRLTEDHWKVKPRKVNVEIQVVRFLGLFLERRCEPQVAVTGGGATAWMDAIFLKVRLSSQSDLGRSPRSYFFTSYRERSIHWGSREWIRIPSRDGPFHPVYPAYLVSSNHQTRQLHALPTETSGVCLSAVS